MPRSGFSASLTINGNVIRTIGDLTKNNSRTEIEVKNRASEEVRYIPGMATNAIDLEIQAGIDEDDTDGINGYNVLKALYDSKATFPAIFTNDEGSWTKNMVCTKFDEQEPLDGLATASVSLKRSAQAVGSSS